MPEKDLFLLIRPLKTAKTARLASASGPNNVVKFRRFQHWAILVARDNLVFEVIRTDNDSEKKHDMRCVPYSQWMKDNGFIIKKTMGLFGWLSSSTPESEENDPHRILIGQTDFSRRELKNVAGYIWEYLFRQRFSGFSTNCQTFALLLFAFSHCKKVLIRGSTFSQFPSAFNWLYFHRTWRKFRTRVEPMPFDKRSHRRRMMNTLIKEGQETRIRNAEDVAKAVNITETRHEKLLFTKPRSGSKFVAVSIAMHSEPTNVTKMEKKGTNAKEMKARKASTTWLSNLVKRSPDFRILAQKKSKVSRFKRRFRKAFA